MICKHCAECGKEITDEYYTVGDNYLQAKYFDSESDNIFCSKDCLCSALTVGIIDVKTGEAYFY